MNKKNSQNILRKIIGGIAVVIWIALIFYFSSQIGEESGKLSSKVTRVVLEEVKRIAPNTSWNAELLDHILRKYAHFLEYGLLGILISTLFSGRQLGRYPSRIIFLCCFIAVLDEGHQIFVPGRGPGIIDIIIDGVGALVGVLAFLRMKQQYRKSRESNAIKRSKNITRDECNS